MRILQLTVTGADDRTSLAEMKAISEDFGDFLEWGILLSRSSEGMPRFPSRKWIEELSQSGLPTSGHFCGTWARDLVRGSFTAQQELQSPLESFRRFQINFHGEEFPHDPILLTNLCKGIHQKVIFQIDGVNDFRYRHARERCDHVVPLFDKSHGEGISPDSWPSPFVGTYCGYAGGLGPDNLHDELRRLEDAVGDNDIWIDMETKVRNSKDEFDLDLVSMCLSVVRDCMG